MLAQRDSPASLCILQWQRYYVKRPAGASASRTSPCLLTASDDGFNRLFLKRRTIDELFGDENQRARKSIATSKWNFRALVFLSQNSQKRLIFMVCRWLKEKSVALINLSIGSSPSVNAKFDVVLFPPVIIDCFYNQRSRYPLFFVLTRAALYLGHRRCPRQRDVFTNTHTHTIWKIHRSLLQF